MPGRVPRVTRLMALAIPLEQLVRDGAVADYAEIARLGHVSRVRMTQITKSPESGAGHSARDLVSVASDGREGCDHGEGSTPNRGAIGPDETAKDVAEVSNIGPFGRLRLAAQ